MARVDYWSIEEKISELLLDTEGLEDINVLIEEELTLQRGPTVAVYLDRRDAPAGLQSASGGQRTRFEIRFSIWCYEFHLDMQTAIKLRDELLGRVEVALIKNSTLGGTVAGAWIEGGEFQNAKNPGGTGFFSGGEIVLVADKVATI